METGSSCQEENGKKLSSLCTIQDEGHKDGECPRLDVHSTQPCVDQQTQGKPKKTPFKFFGGRKSIVTLPSFFGGKHKGFGKGNAKKSMSKSKTHDGISDVPGDDGKKGCSDNAANRHRGHDKMQSNLPSSISADSGITSPVKLDFSFHDISPMGSTECFEKKMNGEKSFSFPRPKKGLKGLFSSIRRHKKNKTPDSDKCERYDHITETVILEQLNKYPSEDAELHCSSEQPKMKSQESGVSSDCIPNLTVVCENEEPRQGSVSMPNLTPQKTEEFVEETSEGLSDDQNLVNNSKPDCLADGSVPEVIPDVVNADLDKESPPNSAGDHLSLMFEDVSSLKSFDSFTGCGDIIAEQDIDNISDTSLSLERSREATKRSSCLVTYQGGGEQMATPDDMEEEYLQRLLEDGNEASYELEEKIHEEMSKGFTELQPHAYSMGAEDAFVDRTVLSSAELLTPQSDQQESAPNSDEGYYDSTTPGPDDDGGEGFSHKERLPRDSYSGDALYEFYEPDDSLMSPAPGGESLYESKTLCSEIFDHFFDFNFPINSGLGQDAERKKGATETEEERLAVIQKQLLFWEMQREAALKGLGHVNKDTFSKEKQIECEIKAVNLMGRGKGCLAREQILLQNVSKDVGDKGPQHTETGKQTWKDYQETDSDYHRSYIHHRDGNGLVENPGFELNVGSLEAQDQSDNKLAKVSNSSITPMHHVQNVFGSEFSCLSNYGAENECEQAGDFADNGMLFSSISERLGSAVSSSSFHHNLNALPTMITFDVVDFENEGECEQQVDLSPDEEVPSSFENFDHRYVQESLAECDEPLLQMDSQQSFQNYNWGVTSLPRHLEQYKLSPFKPVPLSVNRRSKSLDTESLELELGGMQMSKSGLKSYDLLTPWEDRKNSREYEDRCVYGDKARFNSCKMSGKVFLENEGYERYTPVLSPKKGYSREPLGSNISNQRPVDSRELGNATTVTVPYNTRQPQEDSKFCRYSKDNTTKKLARVLPLEEQRSVDTQYSYDYDAPYKQIKTKPVGVTQAMPQQQQKDYDLQSDFMERSGPSKKGILEHRDTSSIDWSNNYSECSNS